MQAAAVKTSAQIREEAQLAELKQFMPKTYEAIQAKAKEAGSIAYQWVRRGLRGEPDCFYAIEGGRVMGTPFATTDIQAHVAAIMVQFGVRFVVIFPVPSP